MLLRITTPVAAGAPSPPRIFMPPPELRTMLPMNIYVIIDDVRLDVAIVGTRSKSMAVPSSAVPQLFVIEKKIFWTLIRLPFFISKMYYDPDRYISTPGGFFR